MGLAFALLALVAVLPVVAEVWRRPMSAERQREAPGEIAYLPRGATHYRWAGREGDPVVVCIHGLATPSYVFAGTERSLTALGYRVLSYDLYGRGFSARVRGAQTVGFFVAQLRALLAHQEVTGPVTLLGFSMGGQIAAALAAAEPDRVERLILVASAGLAEGEPGAWDWVWRAPMIGDWTTLVFGGIALRRELVEHRTLATVIPDFEDRQAAETRMRGYLPVLEIGDDGGDCPVFHQLAAKRDAAKHACHPVADHRCAPDPVPGARLPLRQPGACDEDQLFDPLGLRRREGRRDLPAHGKAEERDRPRHLLMRQKRP